MHHGIERVIGHQPVEKRLVTDIAFDQLGLGRDRPPVTGRQIVEHHDIFADIGQCHHHVAADIACAAGDQNAHAVLQIQTYWLPMKPNLIRRLVQRRG